MVEIVVARADQERDALADAAEILLRDDGLGGAGDGPARVQMVAGEHHHVHLRGRRQHPVELAQVVVQIGDQEAAHGAQSRKVTVTGV